MKGRIRVRLFDNGRTYSFRQKHLLRSALIGGPSVSLFFPVTLELRVAGFISIVSIMIRTLEAEIDEHGSVKLAKPVHLDRSHRALVMIMPDQADGVAGECALLSETALAEDWNQPEEDAAWQHLQPVR